MPRAEGARLFAEMLIIAADLGEIGSSDFAIRWNLGTGGLNFSAQEFEDMTEPRSCAKSMIDLDQRALPGNDTAALSLAERIEIDLAEPRQYYRLLKLACRRIPGTRERQGAGVFERERTARRS